MSEEKAMDARTRYLEAVMEQQEHVRTVLTAVSQIQAAGIPGLHAKVNSKPQEIIDAIVMLGRVIEKQYQQIVELSNNWFDAMDDTYAAQADHMRFIKELKETYEKKEES